MGHNAVTAAETTATTPTTAINPPVNRDQSRTHPHTDASNNRAAIRVSTDPSPVPRLEVLLPHHSDVNRSLMDYELLSRAASR